MSQPDVSLDPTIILPPGSSWEFDTQHPIMSDRWLARIDGSSDAKTKIIVSWTSFDKASVCAHIKPFIISDQLTPLEEIKGLGKSIYNSFDFTVHIFAL